MTLRDQALASDLLDGLEHAAQLLAAFQANGVILPWAQRSPEERRHYTERARILLLAGLEPCEATAPIRALRDVARELRLPTAAVSPGPTTAPHVLPFERSTVLSWFTGGGHGQH